MRKYILQLEKILFFKGFFLLLTLISLPGEIFPEEASQIYMEDLLFFEKVILDFYKGEKSQEGAIRSLEYRCRWKDAGRGLSCANLAILYKSMGDYPQAYTAAAMAYRKEPRNPYYRNLFQQIAFQSGNIRDMEKRLGNDGKMISWYLTAIQSCNENNPEKALPFVKLLVAYKHITKEQFERGIFYSCFKDNRELLQDLKNQALPNLINYTELLREEQDRNHPFYEVWDLDFHRKEMSGTIGEKEIPKSHLTKLWIDFKTAVSKKDFSKANKLLAQIKDVLSGWKEKSGEAKLLAESLELAIELEVSQNPKYKGRVNF